MLRQIDVQIVKRSDRAQGFEVLPKRWIVERTIGWLNRCRRLAKDWENLNRRALAFLRLASIRLMLRKLCNPSSCSRTDSQGRGLRTTLTKVPGYADINRTILHIRRHSTVTSDLYQRWDYDLYGPNLESD